MSTGRMRPPRPHHRPNAERRGWRYGQIRRTESVGELPHLPTGHIVGAHEARHQAGSGRLGGVVFDGSPSRRRTPAHQPRRQTPHLSRRHPHVGIRVMIPRKRIAIRPAPTTRERPNARRIRGVLTPYAAGVAPDTWSARRKHVAETRRTGGGGGGV